MSMSLRHEVRSISNELIEMRRYFHMYPEIGYDCVKTAQYIVDKLRSFGYTDIKTGVAKTGVVATLKGTAGTGPCIALRADMDGLPIQEETQKPYKSKVPNTAHMCGHDAHMSILLGVAKILMEKKSLIRGTVVLIFQPAEEGGAGGEKMVEEGVMDNVDEVYGLHVWNLMNAGTAGVKAGPVMANSDRFYIKITGKGGHGGQPNTTADPIVAAGHLVTALQTIVSRNIDPIESGVVTIGTIHGGTAPNVISDEVNISGTCRSYNTDVQDLIQSKINSICEGISLAFSVKISAQYVKGYPAVVNSPVQTEKVFKATTKIIGNLTDENPPTFMGGEDFAFFLQKKPGCYFFLGSSPIYLKKESRDSLYNNYIPHHCNHFDIAENPTLEVGTSIFVQLIDDLLIAHNNAKL